MTISAPATDSPLGDEPDTATVSPSPSSRPSCVGSRVKPPVCAAEPAGMLISKSATSAKSVPSSAEPEPTCTVTVVAPARVLPDSVAVTVTAVAPSPSPTRTGSTASEMPPDAVSSSVIVTVAVSNCAPASDPATVTVRSPSTAALSTALTVTDTESVNAGSTTWRPGAGSSSAGLTV